jgi:O-antigen/teichoic acid export membrane protein
MAASAATLVIGGMRTILLARWLAPADFGLVALGLVYLGLVGYLMSGSLGMIYIGQRERTPAFVGTWVAVRLGLGLGGVVLLLLLTPIVVHAYPNASNLRWVMLALAPVLALRKLGDIQGAVLRAELCFGKLAWLDLASSLSMTVVALSLAWAGFGWWALVFEPLAGATARTILAWTVFRAWSGRLAWDRDALRSIWDQAKHNWVSGNLGYLLDQFDDFWVGTALGTVALGVYSKAYEMAGYPRRMLGIPLERVVGALYGRALDDRLRLSQLYFRASSALLRANCLVGGLLALALPEFITYVIGNKWQPILWPFRLMLIYVALDAVLMLAGNLMQAVGRPSALRKSRLVQLVTFVPAVIVGAALWGVSGVAVAADLMLVLGGAYLVGELRQVVDLNLWRLLGWPTLALAAGFGVGWWVGEAVTLGPLLTLLSRWVAFGVVFVGGLWLVEGADYGRSLRWLWDLALMRVRRGRHA